jgi:hypothetical protein
MLDGRDTLSAQKGGDLVTKKTLLITFVLAAIQEMPTGTTVRLHELYKNIKNFLSGSLPNGPKHVIDICRALQECSNRGDLPGEPRYRNDIRWAIRQAKNAGILKHVGTPRSGEWVRV